MLQIHMCKPLIHKTQPNIETHYKYTQHNHIYKYTTDSHNPAKYTNMLQIHKTKLNTEMCFSYTQNNRIQKHTTNAEKS